MGAKVIFRVALDDQDDVTLAEAINFLTDLATAQPFPPEEVIIRFEQSDDWDGYSQAFIEIMRDETPDEADATRAEKAAKDAAVDAMVRRAELEQLRRLQSKYGTV